MKKLVTSIDIQNSLGEIKTIGEKLLSTAIKMDARGRTGGYLCVANPSGAIIATIQIGRVDSPEDVENYRRNVQAKVLRLSRNPNHFSGWQSRDFDNKDYGGSIRDSNGNIFGFSGFKEVVDEALCAAILCALEEDLMPLTLQQKIAFVSENPHLIELCEKGADLDYVPGSM